MRHRFRLWRLQREVQHWEEVHAHLLRKGRWLRAAIEHTETRLRGAQHQVLKLRSLS